MHAESTQVLAAIKWVTIPVRIEESLIEIADSLPPDWRHLPAAPSTRAFGSRWVTESRSVALRVPSIVVDGEYNYLLNPRHAEFARLEIGEPQPFSFDPRLVNPGEFDVWAAEQDWVLRESRRPPPGTIHSSFTDVPRMKASAAA